MESAPETRVVMLTASTEEDAVIEAVAAGATGYLQKETSRDRLLSTVRDVVKGELRVPAQVVTRVFAAIRGGAMTGDAADGAGLTTREREILISFAMGMSYARIAEARRIKPVTVRNAIYGIQRKLGVETMQGLGALVRAEWTAGRLWHGRLAVGLLHNLRYIGSPYYYNDSSRRDVPRRPPGVSAFGVRAAGPMVA